MTYLHFASRRTVVHPAARLLRLGLGLWLLGSPGFLSGRGQLQAASASGFKEYEVKAAFLFNFIQFVAWPEGAFPSAEAPLVIGILGESGFDDFLAQAAARERVQGRALKIQHGRRVEDLKHCHILFVCKSENRQVPEILSACRAAPVLTVGESAGFAEKGGVINFVTRANRIQFEINPQAARIQEIKISSRLLRLARIVGN